MKMNFYKLLSKLRNLMMIFKAISMLLIVFCLVIFTPMKICANWLRQKINKKLFIVSVMICLSVIIMISCKSIHSFTINADSIEKPSIHYSDSTNLSYPTF